MAVVAKTGVVECHLLRKENTTVKNVTRVWYASTGKTAVFVEKCSHYNLADHPVVSCGQLFNKNEKWAFSELLY